MSVVVDLDEKYGKRIGARFPKEEEEFLHFVCAKRNMTVSMVLRAAPAAIEMLHALSDQLREFMNSMPRDDSPRNAMTEGVAHRATSGGVVRQNRASGDNDRR